MNIKWYCEARVDTPIELLELMAEAGCISLDFALESGSDKVLKAIRKETGVSLALGFAKNCKRLGIRTLVFTMVSLPEEQIEDTHKTLEIVRALSNYCTTVTLAAARIIPGTEMEELARVKGILPPDFSWFDSSFDHDYTDLAPACMPLYIENLSVDFIRNFISEFHEIKFARYSNISELLPLIFRGIRNIPSNSFSDNLRKVKLVINSFKERLH